MWLLRNFVWNRGGAPKAPPEPVPEVPTPNEGRTPVIRLVLAVVGIALPIAVAAALIPLRDTIAGSNATLILVLPVVAVAIVADRVAATGAAVAAALAYDVFLTEPYYSITIDAADDAEAALVLGIIGIVVGTFVAREVEARSRSSRRGHEVATLAAASQALASGDPQRLVDTCTRELKDLLQLQSCEWAEGFRGTIGHVMARNGVISGWQGPGMPSGYVEISVAHRGTEFGRLILRAHDPVPISVEERRTAVAVADILAAGLAMSAPE